jgi:integrase
MGLPLPLLRRSGGPRGQSSQAVLRRLRFQRRLQEAGLDRRRFHDLCHSAASVMLALGIPLKVVSEVLAHSGIQITADLYGHLEDDVLREQLAILDAAWATDDVERS